jgi:peptide/nickel transport system permease protein
MTRDDLRRVIGNPALVLGLLGALALASVALFGPQLAAGDPSAQRMVLFFPDGTFAVPPSPPSQYYPLGTDPLGRDQLARVLYGARLTFTVILLALFLRATLAIVVGVLGGWAGGVVDRALTTVTNAIGGIPQFLLALLIAVALRQHAILGFTLALGLVGWAEGAQFVRSEVLRIRATGYVEAARALGARTSGLLRRHVLRGLAPQLFGLFSLEAGATLLLLAELGFLGVFMSGGIYLVDAQNRPILPARDRAPEWGQMLAGAQQYAFSNQYVAFVPGVVVCAAVFVFNLLGEGVRNATDPFSRLSLSPRGLGLLGRSLAVLAIASGLFFGVSQARSTSLSFDDALRLARESAARVEPGAPLVAAVVRLRSDSHALERPEKYNFYFKSSGVTAYIRVGFPDGDQNAMETKRDEEDGLLLGTTPLGEWKATWQDALASAERVGGGGYRSSTRTWLVRVTLTKEPELGLTLYRALYSSGNNVGVPNLDVAIDANTGAPPPPAQQFGLARIQARTALNGPVMVTGASAFWRAQAPPVSTGFDADQPVSMTFSFMRSDQDDRRSVNVLVGAQTVVNVGQTSARLPALPESFDIVGAFQAVERGGGREVRDGWARAGNAAWSANATIVNDAAPHVRTDYRLAPTTPQGPPAAFASFTYDLASGRITRVV